METIINLMISLFLIWFLFQRFIPARGVVQIETSELKELLKNKDHQFVDVRTPLEFNTNHIQGFRNIPLAHMKKRHHELLKDRMVIVICQSGARSNKATRVLKKLGFTQITNVKGGMASWRL
ncbi:putative rhodanese domain-containing protein [Bacillus freudenreichii]|nr:putative rhodanese domain-containing protein [Bacillus freudenreichii]